MRIIVLESGRQMAQPCPCQIERRNERFMNAARIPPKFRLCTMDNYDVAYAGRNPSLEAALSYARSFVKNYPVETGGKGLLLTGNIGTGKTHLAVSVLRALILERGASGLFYDMGELLKLIQRSYNRNSEMTEFDVLQPVFETEVLVLDELGAVRPTDWVFDTISLIVNSRYNNRKTTIITTNYANQPPNGVYDGPTLVTHEETLGDRIGERMRSRLHEMCYLVTFTGADYRVKSKRATLS